MKKAYERAMVNNYEKYLAEGDYEMATWAKNIIDRETIGYKILYVLTFVMTIVYGICSIIKSGIRNMFKR